MNNEIRTFVDKHQIRVLDTNKRAHRYTKLNTSLFTKPDDYNFFVDESVRFETESLYTVEIAESELRKIAEFESQVFNNLRENGHFRLFEVLMEQKEREKFLKEKYPAVKKAYEQYSLLLKLAQSGDL